MIARISVAGLMFLALLIVIPTGHAGGEAKLYTTPEAAFKAANEAFARDDWKTVGDCLTEESRDLMAATMVIANGVSKGFAEAFAKDEKDKADIRAKFKGVEAAMDRHGMSSEFLAKWQKSNPLDEFKDQAALRKAMLGLVKPAKDRGALLVDVMKFKKVFWREDHPIGFGKDATLKEVKIKGDRATAIVVTSEKERRNREPIEFHKVGAGWKVDVAKDLLDRLKEPEKEKK